MSSAKQKALLAVAIASQLFNTGAVCAADSSSVDKPLVDRIAQSNLVDDYQRTWCLLRLADAYLDNENSKDAEIPFVEKLESQRFEPTRSRLARNANVFWEKSTISVERLAAPIRGGQRGVEMACSTLSMALKSIARTSNLRLKMDANIVAAALYTRVGDETSAQRCRETLNGTLSDIEGNPSASRADVISASEILLVIADNLVQVYLSNTAPGAHPVVGLKEEEFIESEKLRLRSIALLDRFPESDQDRRKSHRDMTLWYTAVGKPALAENQKRILFSLVGFTDASILFPKHANCNELVWWTKESEPLPPVTYDCGRG